jgi:hypothetical protein
MDALTVAVETRHGHAAGFSRRADGRAALAHDIKTYIGTSGKIELRAEGGVERSLGKAKRVQDQRPEVARLVSLLDLVHQQIEVDVTALVDADAHRQVLQAGANHISAVMLPRGLAMGRGLRWNAFHHVIGPRPPRPGAPSRS